MAKIIHKKSSVAGKIPAINDLEFGELALNYADGKLFYKDSNNAVQSFSGAALSNSTRQQFTATANQTTFNITYTPGQVDVYLNGIKLLVGIDFTATNGSNIILTTGADAGDIVDIVAGTIFASADWQYVTNKPTTISGFGITDAQPLDADLTAISAVSGNTGFLRKIAADTWQLDTNTYLTGNQNIVFSGDVSGNGTTNISLTLANSGVTAGLYGSTTNIPQITVDAKGRVTNVTNVAVSIPSGSLTFTGDVTGTGSTGSSTALTLANSGVTAGTYTKVTVDSKGRATSGTTLSASDIPSLDASKITSGTIDAARLPSYVDDVLEYANLASFPGTGETGKIYVAIDSNKTYRWSGSTYIEISANVGTVTSVSGTGTVSGLTLTGTVTTSGSLTLGGAITGFLPSSGGTLTGAVTSSGTFTSTDNANVNGSNFVVDTINKSLALYAYDVRRSGSTVGGITVGGVGVFASGTTIGGSLAIHAGNYSSYALPLSGGTLTGLVTFDGGSTASAGPVITSSSSSGPRLSIHSTGPGGKNLWLISNSTDNADGAGKLQLWNSTDGYTGLTFATTSSMAHMLYGAYTQMSGSARAPIFYDTNDTGYYIDAASTSVLNSTVMYGHLSNYQPIGASDDVRTGIRMYDTTAMAAGIGGQIVLGYKYTSGGDYTEGAIIKMFKLNGTSGDYSSGLKIQVRDTGEPLATQVVVDPSGNLYSYQSVRAPIFYDSNNTDYYIDPNSYSRINTIALGNAGSLIGSSNSYPLSIYHGTRYLMGFRNSASGTSNYPWLVHDSWNGDAVIFHFNGVADRFRFSSSGIGQADSDFRAPIFYDSDNTGYYIDPNNVSNIHRLNVTGYNDSTPSTSFGIQLGGNAGISTWNFNPNGSGSYRSLTFYATGWNGSAVVTRDVLTIGNYGGYVGIRENNPNNFLQIGSVGSSGYSGNHIAIGDGTYAYAEYLNGSNYMAYYTTSGYYYFTGKYLQADGSMRAPIFYDSNDTNYYLNPNSSSRLSETFTDNSYTYGWFRNYNQNGLYNQTHGNHWYATSDAYWNIAANNTSNVGILFRTSGHQGYVRGYVYADSSNNIGFLNSAGSWRLRVVGDDYSLADGSSMRAQLYYDSNDTGYYVDPHSTSVLNSAYIYRNFVRRENTTHCGISWYSPNYTSWCDYMSPATQTSSGPTGNITAPSGSLVTSWALRRFIENASGYGWTFESGSAYGQPSVVAEIRSSDGSAQFNGSVRTPIYYDSGNTGYYLNGDTNSAWRIGTPSGYLDIGPMNTGFCHFQTDRPNFYFNQQVQFDNNAIDYSGNWALYDSYGIHNSSLRAPIFYDSSDTNYYLDPASTSYTNILGSFYLKNNYDVASDHPYGIYFASGLSSAYAIYRESGAWNYPYPDLRIAFHTGIKIGANASYQGVRFYTDYDMSSQVMSVNNGSDGLGGGNVYVNNSLVAGSSLRAPVFYDSNDTGYYLDPTSTTSLRTVGDWRADSATWTGEFAGKMQYHSSNWYLQFSSNLLFRNSGGTNVLTCDSSGNLTANGNVTAYSDIRLKENIYTIDGALSKVLNLRGVYYNKIGETKRKIGLVAQEAQQVIPEVVISVETVDPATGSTSDLLAVDYGNTVALLIEAVKEQQATIVQQAARIEKLEKLLEKLI